MSASYNQDILNYLAQPILQPPNEQPINQPPYWPPYQQPINQPPQQQQPMTIQQPQYTHPYIHNPGYPYANQYPPPYVIYYPPHQFQCQCCHKGNPNQAKVFPIQSRYYPNETKCPVQITCYQCNQKVVTKTKYEIGNTAFCFSLILLILFLPLFFLPLIYDDCKDVRHYCPNCKTILGIYHV